MRLSDDDVERALFCVNEVVGSRLRADVPVPWWMWQLANRLDLSSLTSGMSPSGHESDGGSEALETSLIGTQEAANLLGLSTRHVRRLAADLDGENVRGRMVFKRSTVVEYAQEKRNGR